MRYPEVSSVFYISSKGGPTIVLNQTTPDGNIEVPELPIEGAYSMPTENNHIVFRGNLQHGVTGSLAAVPGDRITFLVNWWNHQPMPPNCAIFDSQRWRKLGMKRDKASL